MIYRVVNGFLKENAYIIKDDFNNVFIIDPGQFASEIINKLKELNINLINGILLTHGHFDHVNSVDELYKIYKCPVYLSKYDICQIDGTYQGNYKLGKLISILNSPVNDVFSLINDNIIVYETPGHTKGSVCYYFKKENVLFSGDTLFLYDVGRYDLPGGDKKELINSLSLLMSLNDEIIVYPGHGDFTSIGKERKSNEFIILNK